MRRIGRLVMMAVVLAGLVVPAFAADKTVRGYEGLGIVPGKFG